jgi:rhamnose transport system permease protein
LAIVALPLFLVILSGGIDLSVGSILALSGVTLGLLFERGVSPWLSSLAAIAIGGVAGSLNGWFIAKYRVHPLIITLASMAAFRGIAEGISLARPISGYPDSFQNLSQDKLLGIPYPGWIFLSLALVVGFAVQRLRVGRWIRAIGNQEQASRYSGIPVDRIKLGLYTLSGILCGLAAVILVSRNNTAKADMGTGMELEAITAIVLGGVAIEGGKGKLLGVVLGLALIHETREFVSWHWKQSELNLMVMGGLLIGTLLLERLFGSLDLQKFAPVRVRNVPERE